MADSTNFPDSNAENRAVPNGRSPTSTARWVKMFAIGLILLVVLVVVALVFAAGGHTPPTGGHTLP